MKVLCIYEGEDYDRSMKMQVNGETVFLAYDMGDAQKMQI